MIYVQDSWSVWSPAANQSRVSCADALSDHVMPTYGARFGPVFNHKTVNSYAEQLDMLFFILSPGYRYSTVAIYSIVTERCSPFLRRISVAAGADVT